MSEGVLATVGLTLFRSEIVLPAQDAYGMMEPVIRRADRILQLTDS